MRLASLLVVLLLTCLPVGPSMAQYAPAPPPSTYVGIPSVNFLPAAQTNSNWCWAASIQMVMNYYGVALSQEQIVARTYGVDPYGNLPNWTAHIPQIHANLNHYGQDSDGRPYRVTARMGQGAPVPAVLLDELNRGHPVIVGYRSGPNSAHAIVITAARYTMTPRGPMILTLVGRDPWPSPQNRATRGRVEIPGDMLAQAIMAHWYIRVD